MKKILFMALAAITMLSSCSSEDNNGPVNSKPKSLEFTLGVSSPKSRMSDGTVTSSVINAVRSNVQTVAIEYFDAAGASLGTYEFTPAEVDLLKTDDQLGTRVPVRINNIPASTAKVNAYLNVKTAPNINDLQTSYNIMEYRGVEARSIILTGAGAGLDGNDVYSVEVPVNPVLSRFEFSGNAATITVNQTGGTLPAGLVDGTTQAEALVHVSASTVAAAEKSAEDAWKAANHGVTPPASFSYIYNVTYVYNTPYTINSIDGYYMNYIPVIKTGGLIQNTNDGLGNWNTAALDSYTVGTGSLRSMFDVAAPQSGERIAYNLFPQSVSSSSTSAEVKAGMPHFILKLNTSDAIQPTKWITIRAFRAVTGNALVTAFNAGSVYVLDAAEINVNQYTAILTVTADGVPGKDIPEDKDPTDPNPEPVGKDLDVLVKIMDWTTVMVKPEW